MEIELRGENKRFFESDETRKLLIGQVWSGKTYTSMTLINNLCKNRPDTKVLIAGKSIRSLRDCEIYTLLRVIEEANTNVNILGDNRPYKIIYENGSKIDIGVVDNKSNLLGGVWDIVFIPNREGLTLEEFLFFASKARNPNFRQVILESNIELDRSHWIYELEEKYNFEVFTPVIKDNPLYYGWTELGKDLMKDLSKLPDNLKKSLLGEYYQ